MIFTPAVGNFHRRRENQIEERQKEVDNLFSISQHTRDEKCYCGLALDVFQKTSVIVSGKTRFRQTCREVVHEQPARHSRTIWACTSCPVYNYRPDFKVAL